MRYYQYFCNGCGHTTVTDKYYKYRLTYCSVCGNKDRMEYKNEVELVPINRVGVVLNKK